MTRVPLLDLSTPVGQIARFYPAAIAVFEDADVEFACRGGRSVADAANAAGCDPQALLAQLQGAAVAPPAPEETVAAVIHTIITEHHRLTSEALRSIAASLTEAGENGDLARIRRIFEQMSRAMTTHMTREERELFPRLEELELHPHRVRAGSLSRPLLVEFVEHDATHERLTKIREIVLRLRAAGADSDLLDALDELHRAAHRHMHLENNVLAPRVIDLEHRLKQTRREAAQV